MAKLAASYGHAKPRPSPSLTISISSPRSVRSGTAGTTADTTTTQTNTNTNTSTTNNTDTTTTTTTTNTIYTVEELKKTLKQVQNKRSISIASKLSGPSQDLFLKKDENYIKKIDSEIIRIRNIYNKNPNQLVSSLLLDTNSLAGEGKMISCDRCISELEYMKYEAAERVSKLYELCIYILCICVYSVYSLFIYRIITLCV